MTFAAHEEPSVPDQGRPTEGDALTYGEATRAQVKELAKLVADLLKVDTGIGQPTGEVNEEDLLLE